MTVKINGKEYLTKSEVAAMLPSGKIDNQWEKYKLTMQNGYSDATFGMNAFLMNKHTGLVTGAIGLGNVNVATSNVYAANADLAVHNSMVINYCGYLLYGTFTGSPTQDTLARYRNLNTKIDRTTGTFELEGNVLSAASRATISQYIEHFAYIGSKYGKVVTDPTIKYLYNKGGTFYDPETVDLLIGKAWLREKITLPAGYTSSSSVYAYKNFWTGEVILQLSLYPETVGTLPSIPLPDRYKMVKNGTDQLNCYLQPRYVQDDVIPTSASTVHRYWINIGASISFRQPLGTCSWFTGSYYFQGNPETNIFGTREEAIGLWFPESSEVVPSVNNTVWPTKYTAPIVSLQSQYTSGYKVRTSPISFTTWNRRNGMVFSYFDYYVNGTTIPSPITSGWTVDYLPSYRYNNTVGTSQVWYCMCNNYIDYTVNATTFGTNDWQANLKIYTGPTNGVAPTSANTQWQYGVSNPVKAQTDNLTCWQGYWLGNTAENVLA